MPQKKKQYEDEALLDKPRFEQERLDYEAKCRAIGKTPEDSTKPKKPSAGATDARALQACKALLAEKGIDFPDVVKQPPKKRKAPTTTKPKPAAKKAAPQKVTQAAEALAEESSESDD